MAGLNPQVLVTLWNIERLGSFSAVARESGWSQPAISQQIRKCENEIDAKLVQRTSHGVELTPIGKILARHGQLIDNRLAQATKDVEEYRRNGSTHIRLVAPPSVCSSFVARVLVHISKTSDIRVSLMQMEPPEAVDALEQGLADCAITFQYNSLPSSGEPDDLQVDCFGIDPLMLLVGSASGIARDEVNHDGRSYDSVHLADVADEQWIAGCETCQANLVSLARAAGFVPEITHSTDDYWATQNLVEVGMGVSIVSRLATTAGLQPNLTALPIADDNAFRKVCFVTRKADDRPAIARVKEEISKASRQYLNNASL
jgi:DNA-binding transcriptional LysR family regulator